MNEIKPQEVWLAYFPYEDNPAEAKLRPVIILDVDGDKATVLSVMITSHKPRLDEYDIEIYDWEDVPLSRVSTARVAHNAVIAYSECMKRLGMLSDDDWENVTNLYMEWLTNNG